MNEAPPSTAPQRAAPKPRDEAYLVQIGFDFGTSYSKCVCRDLINDRAWVHTLKTHRNAKYPFLIPGSICYENGLFSVNPRHDVHYPENGLYHLKLALAKVAGDDFGDPALDQFKAACGTDEPEVLKRFVGDATTFHLAIALGGVLEGLVNHFGDFGGLVEDTAYVNMAIPVANVSCSTISEAFLGVLRRAWHIADRIYGPEGLTPEGQASLLRKQPPAPDPGGADPCFIYPEVSANVQGFVRSRSAAAGTYLFTDVGAGTVDQATFILRKGGDRDWLTYLAANVLPLGSSQIEKRAARVDGGPTPAGLESWRIRKEEGVKCPELTAARHEIFEEIGAGTHCTLGQSIGKLYIREQLAQARLLFGGGGHCKDPYESGVLARFGLSKWFEARTAPEVVGMPFPRDLDLGPSQTHWLHRLYVAYGLSFFRGDLAPHTLPPDLSDVASAEREIRHDPIPPAPTKDVC